MKKSKLILFLKTLSSSEMKEWARYVYSNSTKKSEDTLAFVNYLILQHPEFHEKKISKEFITKKIYPNDPTNIKKIENMMYKCWSFLEVFLIHEELKQNKVESHFLLLNALRKENLISTFLKKLMNLKQNGSRKVQVELIICMICLDLKN